MNKSAKDFLSDKFQKWYADQITEQLEGEDVDDIEDVELLPIPYSFKQMASRNV